MLDHEWVRAHRRAVCLDERPPVQNAGRHEVPLACTAPATQKSVQSYRHYALGGDSQQIRALVRMYSDHQINFPWGAFSKGVSPWLSRVPEAMPLVTPYR